MLTDNKNINWKWNLFLMWLSQLLVLAGFAAVMPFIPLFIKDELHIADDGVRGVWISVFHFLGSFGYAVFCPIWGALSDRFGVKPMLLRGTFGTALIFPLMAWAGSPLWLSILRFASAACAGTTAAAQILLVKNTPEDKQGFALGVLSTAVWSGAMLGNVLGGLIVHYYGYKATFIICGVMYFLAGFLVLPARENFKKPAVQTLKKPHFSMPMLPKFTSAVWMIITMMFVAGFVRYLEVPYLAMQIEIIAGAEKAAYWTGIISAFVSVGALLSGMLTGYLSDKYKPLYILIPSFVITVITLLIQAYSRDLFIFGFSRTLMYLAGGGVFSVLQKMLTAAAPKRKRGKVFGFSSTAHSGGVMLSTVAAGGVIYIFNVQAVFITAAVLTALMIPFFISGMHQLMRQKYFSTQFNRLFEK